MTQDYSITWQYIVEKMKEKYGIQPDSTEKLSFGEIEAYLEYIWNEYFGGIGKSWKAFFLGVDQSTLYWAQPFGGNLHSSFLFVHAYLGIIGFVVFVGLLVRAGLKAIRSRKWLYFCALLTFAFRGTTDHVFGANRITAIILALILLPDFIDLFGHGRKHEEHQI